MRIESVSTAAERRALRSGRVVEGRRGVRYAANVVEEEVGELEAFAVKDDAEGALGALRRA